MSKVVRNIVVSENNRRFEVIVERNCHADTVHIDCRDYDELERRCDYAIRVSPDAPRHFFFVELKGNDVIRAAEQLKYTVEHLPTMYSAYKHREAWVIAGGWRPAVSTRFQVAKHRMALLGFKLQYHTNFHSVDLTKS